MTIPTEAEAREAVSDVAQQMIEDHLWGRGEALFAVLDRYRDVIQANQPCYYAVIPATCQQVGRVGADACSACEARGRLEG